MIHSIARLGLLGMVALAVLLPIRTAWAQQDNWTDGSGNWSVAGNWSAGVPGSGAIVNITDLGGTVTYDYTGPAVSLDSLNVDLIGGSGSATNTLSMSANTLTTNGSEFIGDSGSGSFNQSGGTNTIGGTSSSNLYIGNDAGSTGNYTLSETGALNVNGVGSGSYGTEYIGYAGMGNFNQSGGTNTAIVLSVGYDYFGPGGSSGTYTLSGTGSLNVSAFESVGSDYATGNFVQSGGANNTGSIQVTGANGSYRLSGSGTITTGYEETEGNSNFIQSGGTNTINGTTVSGVVGIVGGGSSSYSYLAGLDISLDSGASSTYTLSGGTLSVPVIYVGGDLYYPIGGAGGQGTFNVGAGIASAGNIYVGGDWNGPDAQGTMSISGTGSVNVSGTIKVYNTAGTLLTLSGGTINTGVLDLSGNPALLNWTGGTLNLTSSSVELDTSASAWNGFSSLTLNSGMALEVSGVETIGGSGTGSLTESGGNNTINGPDALTLGGSHGSTGTYTLSGGTLRSFGFEYVGFDGTGNFNHSGGTNEINFGYSLYVGYGADASGTYTLSGAGTIFCTGNEYVGEAGIGNFNQSGGSNSMIGGGILSIAQQAGSTGSYTLSAGTLSATGGIYVGGSNAGAGGTGLLTVSGSGSITNADQITVYNTTGSGFNVNGGSVSAGALNLMGTYMHTGGTATYGHITGGGQMAVSGGQVILTDDTSGHLASVNVSGTTTLGFDIGTSSSSQITADTATFNATPTIALTLSGYPEGGTVFTLLSATHFNDNGNLGSLSSQAVVIGRDTLTPSLTGGSGAAGAIIVTIAGGPANLTWIGNNNIGVDSGGAWDTQTTHNWENHSNEALTPDVFYAGDHVTFDDTAANFVVDLNSGDVIANSVTFNNSLNAYTVDGTSAIAGPGSVTFTGSNTVTLNNSNSYTGTTTISGGGTVSIAGSIASPTINVTNGTLQLAADYALTGTPAVTLGNGTTAGVLDLDGTNTNTVSGLSGGAGNLVTNTSSGSATLYFAGGSSTFAGVIQDGNAGGQVALNITSGSLTLCGANTYSGGTTINGGTLAVNGSILGDVNVNYGGTLAGHGSVGGMVTVSYGGFLSPGKDPTSTGTITLGSLTLYSGSQTNIKLAGSTPGSQYDQVQVTGSASLAGTLAVSLINGFAPQAGETFDILTGSTPSGTFDTLQLPSLTGALEWDTSQLYTSGELSVGETFLPGDFNRDGHADASDILAMEQALTNLPSYEQTNGLTDAQLLAIGDLNGDGVVNNADLQALLDLLNSGGGSNAAVPEPTSLMLLAAGSLMLMLLRVKTLLGRTAHNCQHGHCA